MRNTVWLGLIFVASAAAFAACGGSGGGNTSTEGTGDQGTGGNTSTSSSSSSGSGGSTTTSSSSSSTSSSTTSSSTSASSSASSSGSALVNGCDPATAEDHTADSNVMIAFGGASPGEAYSPACIKISAGSSLTFNGSFSSHPLSPGLDGVPDATSPITATATGSTATFTFPDAGTFGWYCEFHFLSGMEGAVFVQ